MGAEIDEGGHQHRARRDEGRAADDAIGNGTEAGALEFMGAPAGELRGHLVPPGRIARTVLDDFHRVEAEGEKHRLLQPLVHGPNPVITAACHPHLAGIEQVQRLLDAVANLAAGGNGYLIAVVPGGFDGLFKCGKIGGHPRIP